MQVAELVVEQVLTGLMVLVAVMLPFTGLDSLEAERLGLLLGASYLLGVPLEAFADHVTGSLEHRLRLAFAGERLERVDPPRGPFPEDHWRALVLGRGGEGAQWLGYLRTRLRIARSLAVYAPVGVVSALLVTRDAALGHAAWAWLLLGVAYLIAFGCASVQRQALPRTEELKRGENFPLGADCVLWWGLTSWGVPAGFVILTCQKGSDISAWGEAVVALVAGVAMQVLSGWSWIKIQKTWQRSLCQAASLG